MLSYYIIENKKKLGQLKGNEFMVKTIVTTETIAEIAKRNNVEIRDVYTGFKWIAREIKLSEGVKKYIGGGEESFGYLPFDKVRDKDSPASICLLCEIAAWAKDNGMTLYDLLMKIYLDYGFAYQNAISVTKPGKSGADEIKQMMEDFRKTPPTSLRWQSCGLREGLQDPEAGGERQRNCYRHASHQQRAPVVHCRWYQDFCASIWYRT